MYVSDSRQLYKTKKTNYCLSMKLNLVYTSKFNTMTTTVLLPHGYYGGIHFKLSPTEQQHVGFGNNNTYR